MQSLVRAAVTALLGGLTLAPELVLSAENPSLTNDAADGADRLESVVVLGTS